MPRVYLQNSGFWFDSDETIPDAPSFPVNIRSFGAKADGVTDCTAAIQSALTYAAGAGRATYVPPGRFVVNGPLSAPDGTVLFGDGRNSCLYHKGGQAAAGSPPYEQILQVYGVSNVEIFGLRFQGDNGDANGVGFVHATGSQEDMLSSAIAMGGTQHDVVVHHCWFENLYGFSVQTGNGTPSSNLTRGSVHDCVMRYNGNGLNVSGTYVSLLNNQLFNAEGIETLGYRSTIANNRTWGGFTGGLTVYGDYASIADNIVDHTEVTSTSTGFNNAPSCFQFPGLRYSTVSGNVAINPGGHAYQFNPDPTPGSSRVPTAVAFAGNSVQTTRTADANSSGPTELLFITGSQDITITGCTLVGVVGAGGLFKTVIGIGIFGSQRIRVVGCTIGNVSTAGIDIESASSDCLVQGCALTNCGVEGIIIQGASARCHLKDNHAVGSATTDYVVASGCTEIMVKGNHGSSWSINSASSTINGVAGAGEAGNSWN